MCAGRYLDSEAAPYMQAPLLAGLVGVVLVQLKRVPQPLGACCSEKLDVEDHYVAWRQTHDQPQHNFGSDGPFSFCSYPYLLSPRAKSKLLHTEARFLMTQVSLCRDTANSASKHVQVAPRCDWLCPRYRGPARKL